MRHWKYLFYLLLLLLARTVGSQSAPVRAGLAAPHRSLVAAAPDTLRRGFLPNYPVLSATAYHGVNLVRARNAGGVAYPAFSVGELRLGVQTTGRKVYDRLWNRPTWGGGVGVHLVYVNEIFGSPTAVYGFFTADLPWIAPTSRWAIGYDIGGGVAFGFRPGDPVTNPRNRLLGSQLNMYFNGGGYLNYRWTDALDLRGALHLMHYSNGDIILPNLGMNMVTASLQLRYHLRGRRPPPYPDDPPPAWRLKRGPFVYQAVGVKQLTVNQSRYLNTTTAVGYRWWTAYRSRWVAQADLFYDGSNNSGEDTRVVIPEDDRQNAANLFRVGVFGGYETVYHRLNLLVGFGVHVWQRHRIPRRVYQRIGLRYRVVDNLEMGVTLKANSWGADYIEWGAGYTFFR